MIAHRVQRIAALAGAGEHSASDAQSRLNAQPHKVGIPPILSLGPAGSIGGVVSLNPPGQHSDKKKKGASQPDRAPFILAQKREPRPWFCYIGRISAVLSLS